MRLAVVILAAGLGTRLKSRKPKVLHTVLGRPMIHYLLDTVKKLKAEKVVIVTNPAHHDVRESLAPYGVESVIQAKMLGTADAARTALSKLKGFNGDVMILNGDAPLVTHSTLRKFLSRHRKDRSDLSVLSFIADNPYSYGRVVRDSQGRPLRIVEEKDLTANQRDIREVNSGIYVLTEKIVPSIKKIKMNEKKREYYLTDILELTSKLGYRSGVIDLGEEAEFLGINTFIDLLKVEKTFRRRILEAHMLNGVRFYDPESVIVHPSVRIGADTIIYPNVCLEGDTSIGRSAILYQGVRIVGSRLGNNVTVLDNSLIEASKVGDGSVIGPFARLRPKSNIGEAVRIGNFVEIKNASLSHGTKASHLSYIGDASVGRNVNIGAGTITCNYDGIKKHRTVIGDYVFVGSDSQFVAPVKIGENAFIAAGSTITKDVSPNALAISRIQQKEISGWTVKKFKKRKA